MPRDTSRHTSGDKQNVGYCSISSHRGYVDGGMLRVLQHDMLPVTRQNRKSMHDLYI
jgi:hypothetical protein